MRKSTAWLAVAALFAASTARAQDNTVVLDNYFETFDGCTFNTPGLPAGWDAVTVGSINNYLKFNITSGGNSYTGDNNWTPNYLLDVGSSNDNASSGLYAVTPPLKGTISFQLRGMSTSYRGPVNIYEMTDDGNGNLVPGTLLKTIAKTELSTSFKDFSIEAAEFTRIGFKLSYAKLDNLKAAQAQVPAIKALKLWNTALKFPAGSTRPADTDGKASFKIATMALNHGYLPVVTDDENATYSVVVTTGETVLATIPVGKTLPAQTVTKDTVELNVQLDDPLVDQEWTVKLRENISGTESGTGTIKARAFTAQLKVYDGSFPLTSPVKLGLVTGSVQKTFSFKNPATAPVTVTEFDLPDWITCSNELPFTVEPDQSVDVTFTLDYTDPGLYDDAIGITHNGNDNSTFLINICAAYAGEGVYANNFNANSLPDGWINGTNGFASFSISSYSNNSYLSAGSSEARIVSPKITFSEGELLTFGAGRTTISDTSEQTVTLLASSDGVEWTELKKVSNQDEPTDFTDQPQVTGLAYFEIPMQAGDWFLAFQAKNAIVDDVFGGKLTPGVINVEPLSISASAGAMVNYPVTVKAKFRNLSAQALDANTYTLSLLAGGKVVASTDSTPALPFGTSGQEFSLKFTPHDAAAALPLNVTMEIAGENGPVTLSTDTIEIAVAEEEMNSEVNVLTYSATVTADVLPVNAYYNHSVTSTVYTKEELGLKPGTKISSITYRYTQTSDKAGCIGKGRVWLANTTADVPDKSLHFTDTTSMTCAVNEILFDFTTKTTAPYGTIVINLDEPFVYTGDNLQITMRKEASSYVKTSFFAKKYSSNVSVYRQSDTYNTYKGDAIPSESLYKPFMTLSLVAEPVNVSGTLVSGGNPLADSYVALVSGDVLYKDTTNAEGKFSVQLKQTGKPYKFTAASPAHLDLELDAADYAEHTDLQEIEMNRNELNNGTYSCEIDETDPDGGTFVLDWDPVNPGSMDESITYTVLLDGVAVAENLTECHYVLTGVTPGEHTVSVKAVFYPSLLESSEIGQSFNVESAVAGITLNAAAVRSVKGGIDLNIPAGSNATVYSVSGECIARVAGREGVQVISLQPGVYVVEVRTSALRITHKVAVR